MLLKTSFLLPHLFCNVEFDFTWFHNNQTVVRDFNSQNRNAWVSRYWNYWVLINAFWIRLDLSDIDIWDIDLSDTDLDLLDKDIHSKHFVCLQDVFKTSSRHVLNTSSRRLQDQQMFAGELFFKSMCSVFKWLGQWWFCWWSEFSYGELVLLL